MAKQPRKVNRLRHNLFALIVLLILTVLVVISFKAVLPSKATSLNIPNHNLLFGENLVSGDPSDAFLTSPALQTGLQNVHTQIIRLPVQGASPNTPGIANWSAIQQAASDIKALRLVPLIVLRNPNDPTLLADDIKVVTYINSLFANKVVYYEFANETDITGNLNSTTASAYVAAWNTVVPQLKSLEPSAQFIGPVNSQYNPAYLSTFLAGANPQPDAISWHEHTCNAFPNDGSSIPTQEANCLKHINHDPGYDWPSHISGARTLMTNAIGKQLPIWITEWNYASSVNNVPVVDPKASDAHFLTQWTTTALETLANNNVMASMHTKVDGLLPLVNDDGSVAPEGAAFQGEFLKLVSHSIPTPTSTATDTPTATPTNTATNTPTPTTPTTPPDSTPTDMSTPTVPAPSDSTPSDMPTPTVPPPPTSISRVTPTPTPTPTPPVSKVIGHDDFHRANQTFWGTAPDRNVWAGNANTLRNFSIFNNTAQITTTKREPPIPYNALLGATATDAEVRFSGSLSGFNSSNLGATLRWKDADDWYKAYIDGEKLVIQKRVNGTPTFLDTVPFVATPNTSYSILFQVAGSNLSAKVWPTNGSTEPSAWMATASDTTFTKGHCGLRIQVGNGIKATVTSFLAQPPSTIRTDIGRDNFQRADQAHWGTAADGQTWESDASTGSNFSIANQTGKVVASNDGSTSSAVLGPSTNDAEVLFSASMSEFNGSNFGAVLRWKDAKNWYKAYIEGAKLIIQKKVDKVATFLDEVPFVAHANTLYSIRFQVVGTNLSAKVWPIGSTEPSAWMATASDSSLDSGYCGLRILVANDAKATVTSFLAQPPSKIRTDIAHDDFQRANQAHWGTAADGQTWGSDASNKSNFSIANQTGKVVASNDGSTSSAILGPSTNDAEVLFSASMSDFHNSNFGAVLRWTDLTHWYKAYIDGTNLIIQKKVDEGTTNLLTIPFAARRNTLYSIRFKVVGTHLSAKVWPTGSTEPSAWIANTTDSSFTWGYCGLRILVPQHATATVTSFQARQVP